MPHDALLGWYAANARDLPWRRPGTSPWAVLVSEVMLQQTPVARVEPVFTAWLERWPRPQMLAREPVAEAIRAWGRLGYPRRAVRLHAAAGTIVSEHGGQVPRGVPELRALPGVGEYTAAAVAAFAHGQRVAVLDTNVRRVLARWRAGAAAAPTSHLTGAERSLAAELLPQQRAPEWSVAVMELGALVCTSRRPTCQACPLAGECAWLAAGMPEADAPPPRQPFAGTDRQARGVVLRALREAVGPLHLSALLPQWPDRAQAERAVASLVEDGLVSLDGECARLGR